MGQGQPSRINLPIFDPTEIEENDVMTDEWTLKSLSKCSPRQVILPSSQY